MKREYRSRKSRQSIPFLRVVRLMPTHGLDDTGFDGLDDWMAAAPAGAVRQQDN